MNRCVVSKYPLLKSSGVFAPPGWWRFLSGKPPGRCRARPTLEPGKDSLPSPPPLLPPPAGLPPPPWTRSPPTRDIPTTLAARGDPTDTGERDFLPARSLCFLSFPYKRCVFLTRTPSTLWDVCPVKFLCVVLLQPRPKSSTSPPRKKLEQTFHFCVFFICLKTHNQLPLIWICQNARIFKTRIKRSRRTSAC